MADNFKSNVLSLVKDLRRAIAELESELETKKSALHSLEKIAGIQSMPVRTYTKAVAAKPVPSKRGGKPGRRKSKNRDLVIAAASALPGKFSLTDLLRQIHKTNPGFGGKFAASALITVLKTTPEVKKLDRGVYKFVG